jgi:integrase
MKTDSRTQKEPFIKKHTTKKKRGGKKTCTRGFGRLYKRVGGKEYPADSEVNAPYWLQYTIPNPKGGRGVVKREPLRDADGNPITHRDKAEAERKRILSPYQTGNAVETLKVLKSRIDIAQADHATALAKINRSLQLTATWAAYIQSPERPDSGSATLGQYGGHWNRFTRWLSSTHPEVMTLAEVTPAMGSEYATNLIAGEYSSNAFNKHVSFLKLLFRVLEEPGRILMNPFQKVKRRTLHTHSRREFTIQELTTILDKAEGDLALLLYLGACTGLRFGDCCTLTWGDVDLARGIIRRIPNKTARNGKPVIVGIPPALHERLSAIATKRQTGFVLPAMAETYQRNAPQITVSIQNHIRNCGIDVHAPGTGQQVKRNKNGIPERDEKTGRVITVHTKKPAVVDVGFHSLRHTWVSMHAARGTPQAIVQASVGHANPAMTAHYTHIDAATARDVARALPAFTGTNGSTPREPLPVWARDIIEKMTPETCEKAKAALLEGRL